MQTDLEEVPQRAPLYEKFGWAAEAAQLLETELSTCIFALEVLDKKCFEKNDSEQARDYLRKLDKSTLGQLINRLSQHLDTDIEKLEFLKEALSARNKLNHGFFERHGLGIQSEEGRARMIEELEDMHQTLFDAYQLTGVFAEILVTSVKLLKRVQDN